MTVKVSRSSYIPELDDEDSLARLEELDESSAEALADDADFEDSDAAD